MPWAGGGFSGTYWLYGTRYSGAEPTDDNLGFALSASLDQANMRVTVEYDYGMQVNMGVESRKKLGTDYFLTKVVPKG